MPAFCPAKALPCGAGGVVCAGVEGLVRECVRAEGSEGLRRAVEREGLWRWARGESRLYDECADEAKGAEEEKEVEARVREGERKGITLFFERIMVLCVCGGRRPRRRGRAALQQGCPR